MCIKLCCFNYIIVTSSSSDTATAAAIGGAVGGAVLLISLVTLGIVAWCVVHRYKTKKKSYSTNQPRFAPALASRSSNPRYLYELTDMKNTERNTGVEARMCKYYLNCIMRSHW